jgi:hypothetical protein
LLHQPLFRGAQRWERSLNSLQLHQTPWFRRIRYLVCDEEVSWFIF